MKRLNETELDARIHKFLGRKLAEFPDLKTIGTKPDHVWRDTKGSPRHHRSFQHWIVETP